MEQLMINDIGKVPFKINKPIRLIELFAGIGCQAKALENIGADFEHYRVCEFDKYAISSYNAVHGTDFKVSDIRDWKGEDLGIVERDKYCYLLTYSFPCQDISVAGKQASFVKGSGTRSGLLWEVERLLHETDKLPQVLLMENVPNIHGKKNMPLFQEWIDSLAEMGYTSYWQDLNAKDYGIPQNRNRTFMISIQGNYSYEFPEPFELKLRLKDMLEPSVDEKYYLSEKAVEGLQRQMELPHKPNIIDAERERESNADYRHESGSVGSLFSLPYKDRLGGINGDVCKTVRASGRSDIHKKHSWDLVYDGTDSD